MDKPWQSQGVRPSDCATPAAQRSYFSATSPEPHPSGRSPNPPTTVPACDLRSQDALERLRDTVKIANPIDPEDGALKALVGLRNRLTWLCSTPATAFVDEFGRQLMILRVVDVDEK